MFVQKRVFDEFVQRLIAEVTLRDPGNHLNVAQPARAFLNIGFEVVRGVVEARMAFALFFPFSGEEFICHKDKQVYKILYQGGLVDQKEG